MLTTTVRFVHATNDRRNMDGVIIELDEEKLQNRTATIQQKDGHVYVWILPTFYNPELDDAAPLLEKEVVKFLELAHVTETLKIVLGDIASAHFIRDVQARYSEPKSAILLTFPPRLEARARLLELTKA